MMVKHDNNRRHNGHRTENHIDLDIDTGAFTYWISSGGMRISGDAETRAEAEAKIAAYYERTALPV